MTDHIDNDRSTSNDLSNKHDDFDLGPTGRLDEEPRANEIRFINLDNCTADVIFQEYPDGRWSKISFGFSGELRHENDLRAAVYQVYKALYRTRQYMDVSSPDIRPQLFHSLAEASPVSQEYDVTQKLSMAAERGIKDAQIDLDERSKAEVTYRIVTDESHLDISGHV